MFKVSSRHYVVVYGYEISDLEEEVNDLIEKGWTPIGGVMWAGQAETGRGGRFYQAMHQQRDPWRRT